MESKKIDLNKQGIEIKATELGNQRKKCNELKKVLKLKANNLIQANHGIYKRGYQICLKPKKRSLQAFSFRKYCLRNF